MGGRGSGSGIRSRQFSIYDEEKRIKIEEIISNSNILRDSQLSGSGISAKENFPKQKKCACCGNRTIPNGTKYEKCSICGWIDDPYQNRHINSLEGKNPMTLFEAQIRFNNI